MDTNERVFFEILDRFVVDARLDFLVDGRRVEAGRRGENSPEVVIRIESPDFFRRVLSSGNLGMAEAFMGREFEMEQGNLTEFLTILIRNRIDRKIRKRIGARLAAKMVWLRLSNRLRGRLKNIEVHYDRDDDALFEAFLDPAMVYSCGYVRDPKAGIERFQFDKMERVCRKLRLEAGQRLVDIGCGYGGMLIHAARHYGVYGKGVTLGRRHFERAKQNVSEAGLSDRIEIEFAPYESLTGTFDRMLSLGMMEHLDRREYGRFTRVVHDILSEDGIGLFHYIGCTSPRNQHIDIEADDVEGFLGVLLRNKVDDDLAGRLGISMLLRLGWIKLRNRLRGRFSNVHRHFDIGNDLYEAFLDETLAYTCGYVTDEEASIESIQAAKYERICTKLDLEPGDRLADLGCGFGGLLVYAAKHRGITGRGLTISKEQHRKSNEIIAREGLSDRIQVVYSSYEDLTGTYDKIVSVGMMEHLQNDEYPRCVGRIASRLTPQGRGLIHFIGSNGPELPSDGFVQKYIFPGAHWPCLSVLIGQLERNHLAILDVENLVRHYTVTLRKWLGRFRESYATLDHGKYDERFRRLWEYYLGSAVAASLVSPVALYQILFTADPAAPMPYQRV